MWLWTGLHGLPARNGKLKDLSHFDATFFGVHAKQAHLMDPQLRILLELTHEAIIDAGILFFILAWHVTLLPSNVNCEWKQEFF